ncbi:MAG TPA: triose-phosphate isomerase [Dissulfurispiraceae bacterium]|nr:triose-phosphate isomerase [Dissulfurispiraceae bacterium]
MRVPVIAANWKMNKKVDEAQAFLDEFIPLVWNEKEVEIVIAPPFTALYTVANLLKITNIRLAAQNVFYEEKGAYTGEISPVMLTDIGCSHVIIGHSERRSYFGDTDDIVNKKIGAALKNGLKVIFCIGESLSEREAGMTFNVLKRQISCGLKGISPDALIVAYEPVWAIGTGKTATPDQAQEAHKFIRDTLGEIYGAASEELRILYGGSVTPDNVDVLMACPDVDGALVGGASLKADSFAKLVKYNKMK